VRAFLRTAAITIVGIYAASCARAGRSTATQPEYARPDRSAPYYRLTSVNGYPLPYVDSANVDSFRGPAIRLDSGSLVVTSKGAMVRLRSHLPWLDRYPCAALGTQGSGGVSTVTRAVNDNNCDELRTSVNTFVLPFSPVAGSRVLRQLPVYDRPRDIVGWYRGALWDDSASVVYEPVANTKDRVRYHFERVASP
jgi:hypothetical protein